MPDQQRIAIDRQFITGLINTIKPLAHGGFASDDKSISLENLTVNPGTANMPNGAILADRFNKNALALNRNIVNVREKLKELVKGLTEFLELAEDFETLNAASASDLDEFADLVDCDVEDRKL